MRQSNEHLLADLEISSADFDREMQQWSGQMDSERGELLRLGAQLRREFAEQWRRSESRHRELTELFASTKEAIETSRALMAQADRLIVRK
jgi:hypothetical protein